MRLKFDEFKTKIRFFGISFTFAIASLVLCGLSLTGHCSSSSISYVTEFPLPYGGSSGYGYSDYPLTESIAEGALSFALSKHNYQFNLVTVYEIGIDNSYIDFLVYVNEGSNFFLINVDYPSFASNGTFIRNNASYGAMRIRYSSGSYSVITDYTSSWQFTLMLVNCQEEV